MLIDHCLSLDCQTFISHSSGAWEADSVLNEDLLLGLCVLTWLFLSECIWRGGERERDFSLSSSSYKSTNLKMRASLS